jgi:putative aminopeptidase FrvX
MGQRDLDSTEGLLQELLWTYGPCGQEDAVRTVCARELQPLVDDMWTDDAGNLPMLSRATIGTGRIRSPAGPRRA